MALATAAEPYDLWLIVIGVGVLIAALTPRLLTERPLSMPILLLALGLAVGLLPLPRDDADPLAHLHLVERLAEFGVIIALTGAGLRLGRPVGLHRWAVTWRLLGITMVLTIAAVALLGWGLGALAPASAILLGAVLAPTDPVLASEVQSHPPGEVRADDPIEGEGAHDDHEVRFALTSEAGLNDGLAFPFTHLALALVAATGSVVPLVGHWLLVDVLYRCTAGLLVGWALGAGLAVLVRAVRLRTEHATALVGLAAVATTLVVYGIAESLGGYGFIAVFVAALVLQRRLRRHPYHFSLTVTAEELERLATALLLVGVGVAVIDGALRPLTWPLAAVALLVLFVVRPAAGLIALIGHRRTRAPERLFIAFFGIRGIGSLYYLAYAMRRASFPGQDEIWAVVLLVILVSVIMHGATASPLGRLLDRARGTD